MTDPNETTNQPTRDVQVNATPKKKLIETSLPLEAINFAAAREKKSIRKGLPLMVHLYWARRPIAVARGVLFAQLVDDPASRPEEFPTIAEQDAERARLHHLLEQLIVWENSNDETLLLQARTEIRKSNNGVLPTILDPFAGGGAIPLEAQRLGLEAHASDLNPLAVLINKALVEIPPKFAGVPPVHPGRAEARNGWSRAEGLAEDVRAYGEWMRNEAERRIGGLYPKVIGSDGSQHAVIAWIWARTVKSPNPANPIEVPLVRSWWLSKKKGAEAWIEAEVVGGRVQYQIRRDADGPSGDDDGTIGRKGGYAVGDRTPLTLNYVREQGRAGRMGSQLIAIVAEGERGRLYLPPTAAHADVAQVARPSHVPEGDLPKNPRDFKTPNYGLTTWADLFTNRQLVALTTLSDLVSEAREKVLRDAAAVGFAPGARLEDGGSDAAAYADAVATYLALAVSRETNASSSICGWDSSLQKIRNVFSRQAVPMVWDYAEVNVFSRWSGGFITQIEGMADAIDRLPAQRASIALQADAATRDYSDVAISTDPPYYDNIGYSDLSDFFYVWLRRSLGTIHSKLVGTMLTPKAEELVADAYRHKGKAGAERFFVDGFNSVFASVRAGASLDVPLTVYYAYKQQDSSSEGSSSTGWHTLLDGLIETGWEITATWPMRTEMSGRLIGANANALASSIVLACRPRPSDAPTTTRRAFVAALKSELPQALHTLMQGTIAPVDLAQAAIGPGISVFSRYSRVREADGSDMSVKDALLLVNATLDEVIGEQESDFDPDTRFAVKWYRQYGWMQENSGIADQLARSSDTSIGALERGGIFEAKGGKARLLSPTQLEGAWDVSTDERVSVWEATVRLAAVMAKHGADQVASLLPSVQTRVNLDAVKELGFLLFHEAEKKRDTKDAILFNGLVSAWGDVNEQARNHAGTPRAVQQAFDFDEDGD
jgi:putative DNA methylase